MASAGASSINLEKWQRQQERNMKAVKDTVEEIQRPLALPFIAQSIETQI